jgi:signal transduction histidine kinase
MMETAETLMSGGAAPDFRYLFESAPGMCLVLTAAFRVVAVTDAYLRAATTTRETIVGRNLLDVLPELTSGLAPAVLTDLRASLERVLETRRADSMPVQKYALRRPESEGGGVAEHQWSSVNSPVLGPSGEVLWIIHRIEDVSEFRLLAARLLVVREEERASIARDLHDELGQLLSGIHVDLANLKRRLEHDQTAEALAKLHLTMADVAASIQVVRRLATNLRPPLLDQVGLGEAIKLHAYEFQTRSGIEVRVRDSSGDLPLDATARAALFRIVQESLTNVLRHAGASLVTIGLERNQGKLLLTIVDNGAGFDPAKGPGRSLGLLGMEERARLVGATFNLITAPGCGTTIAVQLPLPPPQLP